MLNSNNGAGLLGPSRLLAHPLLASKLTKIVLIVLTALMLGNLVVPAVVAYRTAGKNDFSDLYCAARLWRNGQNPYDSSLATALSLDLTRMHIPIVPVYPATAYAIVAPLTFLTWEWANVLWALLGLASVSLTALFVLGQARFTTQDTAFWAVTAFIFSYAPFHTAVHVANVTTVCFGLCVLAIGLAERKQDFLAGIVLVLATGLKPQLGIWIWLFYLLRRRWELVSTAVVTGALLTAIALIRIPVSVQALFVDYRTNLHYWFGRGGQNDFSAANPLHFQLLNAQVILHPLLHSVNGANFAAWGLFLLGTAIWLIADLTRPGSELLAFSSLLTLSLLPFYHRSYDAVVLILALCWALSETRPQLQPAARVTLVLLLVFLFPGQSLLIRLQPHLPRGFEASALWNLLLAPYAVWALLLLNGVLLYALVVSKRPA